jgi:hypothetical protein
MVSGSVPDTVSGNPVCTIPGTFRTSSRNKNTTIRPVCHGEMDVPGADAIAKDFT